MTIQVDMSAGAAAVRTAPAGPAVTVGDQWHRAREVARTTGLCLLESRPVVQVVFGLRFLTGAALRTHGAKVLPAGALLFGLMAWLSASVVVYLLNGACDVVEDRVGGKGRPVATGRLDPAVALRYTAAFALVSLVLSSYNGFEFTLLDTLFLVVGYAYSAPRWAFKRHWFGAAFSAATGGMLTVVGGHLLGGGSVLDAAPLLLAVALSVWMGAVGAVAKDFSDVHGDRAAGRRTLAVLLGAHRARWVVAATATVTGGGFVLLAHALATGLMPAAAVMAVGAIGVAVLALCADTGSGRSRARRAYQAYMVTQYSVIVVALLT